MMVFAVLGLLISGVAFCYVLFMVVAVIRGAPYVPTDRKSVETMIDLTKPKTGERGLDLGSGDGRLVVEMGKRGCQALGIEINPFLVLYSRYKIRKMGLSRVAKVVWGNMWKPDFGGFDIVTVYGFPSIMRDLEKKLLRELKPGSRVVSKDFKFSDWIPETEKDGIYLYIK